jgi:hypothetical protein
MCSSGGSGALLNLFVNPGANLVKDKKDNKHSSYAGGSSADNDKLAEEEKQKTLNARRRSRKSTILSAGAVNTQSGAKTLLGN